MAISKPKIKSRFACFRNDTIKLNGNALRLTLNGQRIWLPFNVPDKFKKYLEYPIARSEVREVKGKWFLYLTVKEPTPELKGVSDVLGIDLGLAKIAVASNIEGSIFFRGDEARAKRQYFEQKADELKHKKDTKQAKGAWRVLKRLSGKEHRWIKDLNHKISRTIVDLAKRANSAIALENLKGIRHRIKGIKKTNRMLHKWPFRQLRSFIEYKAKQAGVPVVPVEPRKTSSVCSRCGAYSWSRKHQPQFKCKTCDFELNRDLNAARNLSLLGRHVLLGMGLLTRPMRSTATQVPIGNPLA
ncbi:transposase [Dehalococcoidales bacterium]|nr:transposase [Dehalococcoidales bacterium]